MVVFDEEKQKKRISEIHHREEEALVQQIAQRSGVTYIDLTSIGIDTDALKILTEAESRKREVALFKLVGKQLHVAARSPRRDDVLEIIEKLEHDGYQTTLYMVSTKSLEKAWDRYEDISLASTGRGSFLDISEDALKNIAEQIQTNADVKTMFDSASTEKVSHRISRLIEIIFGSGIALGASDIHIEPQEKEVRLRYRTDGVLHDVLFLDHDTYRMINSRIKLLSELKLTQTQDAQDGRFTINYEGKQIEIRTSIIPGGYGESIVMRILNPDGINVGLEQLGMEDKLLDILKHEIGKPNGLILTTGPTGSGKTTTLYSFLKYVYDPEIKILTIEDPIEYHLQGITQTQVDHEKGYDFLSGLRAALRQDPDIVMVGEIRDKETATIAVNAALTGHLVLSTLHTNNAAGAIPRLLDLGVNPGILAAALSASIAQRLVRRLCVHCKKERPATPEEDKTMRAVLKMATDHKKNLGPYDLGLDKEVLSLWEPVGCEKCGMVGYKGRVGVYEAILNDESIQQILEKHPSEREIKITSVTQGILSMKEDGVVKILTGATSLEEVQKVVDLEEDLHLFGGEEKIEEKVAPAATPAPAPTPTVVVEEAIEEVGPSTPSVRTSELELLVDYLKLLEREQIRNPELGISNQVKKVRETILDILKNGGIGEMVTSGRDVQKEIHQEVDLLVRDLQKLENEQKATPDVGVAQKLKNIRETIENL